MEESRAALVVSMSNVHTKGSPNISRLAELGDATRSSRARTQGVSLFCGVFRFGENTREKKERFFFCAGLGSSASASSRARSNALRPPSVILGDRWPGMCSRSFPRMFGDRNASSRARSRAPGLLSSADNLPRRCFRIASSFARSKSDGLESSSTARSGVPSERRGDPENRPKL